MGIFYLLTFEPLRQGLKVHWAGGDRAHRPPFHGIEVLGIK